MTVAMVSPVSRGAKGKTPQTPEPVIEKIGPKRATELLAANKLNRNVRQANVERYALDMTSGRWLFNGAPIIVSDTGKLLDGQHRLLAVVESGMTLPFVVLYDAAEEIRDTVDQGSPRRAADILSFAGIPDATMVAAIARVVLSREAGNYDPSAVRPSNVAARQWVLDHPMVTHAAAVAHRGRRHVPASPSIVGAAYYLCAQVDVDHADRFFITRLIDLEGLSSTDPARALHRRLAEMPKGRDGANRGDQLAYIIQAWNHDRAGRKVSKLQSPHGGWNRANFPEPK